LLVGHAVRPVVVRIEARPVVGRDAVLGQEERQRRVAVARDVGHCPVHDRLVAALRPVRVRRPAGDVLVQVRHGAEHAVHPLRAAAATVVGDREQAHARIGGADRVRGVPGALGVLLGASDVARARADAAELIAHVGLVAELDVTHGQGTVAAALPERATRTHCLRPAGKALRLGLARDAARELGQQECLLALGGQTGHLALDARHRRADLERHTHDLGVQVCLVGQPGLPGRGGSGDHAHGESTDRRQRRRCGLLSRRLRGALPLLRLLLLGRVLPRRVLLGRLLLLDDLLLRHLLAVLLDRVLLDDLRLVLLDDALLGLLVLLVLLVMTRLTVLLGLLLLGLGLRLGLARRRRPGARGAGALAHRRTRAAARARARLGATAAGRSSATAATRPTRRRCGRGATGSGGGAAGGGRRATGERGKRKRDGGDAGDTDRKIALASLDLGSRLLRPLAADRLLGTLLLFLLSDDGVRVAAGRAGGAGSGKR